MKVKRTITNARLVVDHTTSEPQQLRINAIASVDADDGSEPFTRHEDILISADEFTDADKKAVGAFLKHCEKRI